jgi:hypothetical protein
MLSIGAPHTATLSVRVRFSGDMWPGFAETPVQGAPRKISDMTFASLPLATPAELVRVGWTVGITVLVVFIVVIGAGFTILYRRRTTVARRPIGAFTGVSAGGGAQATRANILLVRLDDAVKSSSDELGFAIAQFGEEKTRDFSAALDSAKKKLTMAFTLKQRLDDSTEDTATQQREWNASIISLCESAQAELSSEEQRFGSLRRLERDAPANLAAVRELIATTSVRVAESESTLARLRLNFAPNAVAPVTDNARQASRLLSSAISTANSAESRMSGDRQDAVADAIQSAQQDAGRAAEALDGIDRLAANLGAATSRLGILVGTARDDLAEARSVRDAPPDPEKGAVVGDAIAAVDRVLATIGDPAAVPDPAAAIHDLETAIAELDVALGSARNQAQRLEHARVALVGALLTARSQISTTTDFINGRRSGVGTDARTRLAEAERLLAIAEAEADPVTALDTARSSITYSRDADALARYDVMGRP